jgi:hypothetical protein
MKQAIAKTRELREEIDGTGKPIRMSLIRIEKQLYDFKKEAEELRRLCWPSEAAG